jgi:cytochrome b561
MNPDTTPSFPAARPGRATPWRYDLAAVGLHWLLALLLTFIAALGWYMMSVEDEPGSGRYFELHKSLGLVIAALVAARILWRLTHRPAALPASVPAWQARLSAVTVGLLYALMVLLPITGYLGASYSKHGVALFGLATPQWALPDHDTAEWFFDIHGVLIWVLVALVAVHVLGALKHLLIDKDGVFQRMGFGARR